MVKKTGKSGSAWGGRASRVVADVADGSKLGSGPGKHRHRVRIRY